MKFFTYNEGKSGDTIFSVSINPIELADASHLNNLFQRFQISVLSRLAVMVAGYYFKVNKDKIDIFLQDQNLEAAIQKAIVEKIKDRIQILS